MNFFFVANKDDLLMVCEL